MSVRPSEYPPPFDWRDYVAVPTDPVDERIEVGLLIVGAGPAGLACAIRFGQLLEEHPDVAARLGEVPVAIVEKGKQAGSHLLSGAILNPRSLRTLLGDPVYVDVNVASCASNANSSPPMRQAISHGAATAFTSLAIAHSTWSPGMWPKSSLIFLK